MSSVTGWRCAVCDATVGISSPFPWRCPNSTTDRHHVLTIETGPAGPAAHLRAGAVDGDATSLNRGRNTLYAYDGELAWSSYAAANGLDGAARAALVDDLDDAVAAVDGSRFVATPFGRSAELSAALGFDDDGGIWVKDETGGVGRSQKARHLVTILLHLRAAEAVGHLVERPPLAIASCGNAALAAATLAKAASWPIDVYVPTWMTDGFGVVLDRLGARVHRCPRRDDDPPGDPAMFRFREAVAAGSIPFTVQGPENALALDGGRTIGWEIADALAASDERPLDRVVVQVGGGAFAACLGAGLRSRSPATTLDTVQTAGCAPLARAWERARMRRLTAAEIASNWSTLMTVWDGPHSAADGILDDETYDWLGAFEAMHATGGRPIVAAEQDVLDAHDLARSAGFDVSPTGSAGLAGLLATRGDWAPDDRIGVVMSGITR